MKVKTLLGSTTLALAGWLALASASPLKRPALSSYQLAQNEQYPWDQSQRGHDWKNQADESYQARPHHARQNQEDESYQGQRGHWYQEHNGWQWRGVQGDEWYQGQRGHWYQEPQGWQFGSDGLVCNPQGRNCQRGGYIPPNGEGMVSRNHQNVYWACDSDGHKCHWAPRPR
jgi:hypothetical protein